MLAAGVDKGQSRHVAPPLPRMAAQGAQLSQQQQQQQQLLQQQKTLARISQLQKEEYQHKNTDQNDTERHEVLPPRRAQETEISRNLAERRQRSTTHNVQTSNPLTANVRSQGVFRGNGAVSLRQEDAPPPAARAPQSLSVPSRQTSASVIIT